MNRDAQHHVGALWPWVPMTQALGSFGPLLYLLRRAADPRD